MWSSGWPLSSGNFGLSSDGRSEPDRRTTIAPGAAGNLATEDLVFLAFKVGLGTGVDFARLWEVVYDLERMIGRPIGGRIRQWWESSQDHEPRVDFN